MPTTPATKAGPVPQVSAEFRKEAIRSLFAIIAFIIAYILMFIFALGLVAVCFYLGYLILSISAGWLTLLLSLGIVGCGIMVFIFLIKFLFARSIADESDCIQVKEQEQPQLFNSIRILAKQVGTPMPKKVFLCPDVNASVSYNSSFWSMFLPVRKNLRIGLGLVNSLNVSELEAVIAHEFGHFSQRSMKLGSWVYQVNKIIFDMLYNNESYGSSLTKWGEASGIFQLFVWITVRIIKGIQWVLQQMYKLVNKSYKRLSRQMEFHADLVAASVRGSNNSIHALLRSDIGGTAFNETIEACNKAWEQKAVTKDFFSAHSLMVKQVGARYQMSMQDDLPVIIDQQENNLCRINYKDQWSSHPTFEERKENLEAYGHEVQVDTRSAWELFCNKDEVRKQLTALVYRDIPKEEVATALDQEQFELLLKKDLKKDALPEFFKGFFDHRQIEMFDVDEVMNENDSPVTLEDVFNEEVINIPKRLRYLEHDIYLVQDIIDGNIDTATFDFDGQKYKRKDAPQVLAQLQEEVNVLAGQLKAADKNLFRYFYSLVPGDEAAQFKNQFREYFDSRSQADLFFDTVNEMMGPLWPVYRQEAVTMEQVVNMIQNHKQVHEPLFKNRLRQWLPAFTSNPELQASIEKFLASDYQYFHDDSFFDNEMQELHEIMSSCCVEVNKYVFGVFRTMIGEMCEFKISPSLTKVLP